MTQNILNARQTALDILSQVLYKKQNLDDVFDKLDMERVKQLIVLVGSERFGQVFLTDTQKERIEMMFQDIELEHEIFIVEKDKICSLSIENKNEN